MKKVFSTKNVLVKGIVEYVLAEYVEQSCACARVFEGCAARVVDNESRTGLTYLTRGEWHHTKDEAIAKAEEIRIKKLQSLDRQMKKLSAKKFD